jgi:hypothetical protein
MSNVYYIENKITYKGKKLALTFEASGKIVTVQSEYPVGFEQVGFAR